MTTPNETAHFELPPEAGQAKFTQTHQRGTEHNEGLLAAVCALEKHLESGV